MNARMADLISSLIVGVLIGLMVGGMVTHYEFRREISTRGTYVYGDERIVGHIEKRRVTDTWEPVKE